MEEYKIIIEEINTGVIDKKEFIYTSKRKKYALNDFANVLYDIIKNNFECDKKIITLLYDNKPLYQNVYEHGIGYSIKLVDAYFNAKLWDEIDKERE